MSFFSWEFLAFLGGSLLLYYLLPRRVQWVILLLLSLGFYLLGGLWMGLYLGFTVLTTYFAGRLLTRWNDRAKQDKTDVRGPKRLATVICLLLNFGMLYTLKYWNFTGEILSGLTGGRFTLPYSTLLLPLGLSYYIFQSVGYVIDCYRGKQRAERNPFRYALFVSFFPQLVQGPISRYGQLAPQLTAPHRPDADQLKYGIQLALWGYVKKLVLADRAAPLVLSVLGAPEQYGGAVNLVAMLFYCVQLYCDFSGGIDITRGVAQMFGIDLAENFRRPIFAASLADYWRRWHISLGSWMRDYVFYPLSFSKPLAALGRFTRKHPGGKLGKVIPTAVATFAVYFIIGIWHGANFRYVAYGLYYGTLLTLSVLLAGPFSALKKRLRLKDSQPGFHAFQLLRTMLLVLIGRYMTRAPRLLVGLGMLARLFTAPRFSELTDGTLGTLGMRGWDFALVGVGTAILLLLEWRQERGVELRKSLERRHAAVQWLCILLPLALLTAVIAFSGEPVNAALI